MKSINGIKFWIYLTFMWNFLYYNINIFFFVYFLFSGQRVLAIPVTLPYTDIESNYGYLVNIFLHMGLGFIGFTSFCAYEMVMILKCVQGANIQMIIESKLEHLSEELNNIEKSKLILIEQVKEQEIRNKLIEIIDTYEDYKSYMNNMITYLMPSCIAVVVFNIFGLCACILLILSTDVKFKVITSIILTSGLFIMCIIPCSIGTFLTVHNEKFLTNVCAVPWYKLSLKNQKIFLQFIMVCQDPPEWDAPVLKTFSFSLLTDILSSTYTYFMYIWYFVNKN